MKLYLTLNKSTLPGYEVISDDIIALQKYESGEIDEIICDHIIEHLDLSQLEVAIKNWCKKLKTGGLLIVTTNELYELTRLIYRRQFDELTVNKLLYGETILKRSIWPAQAIIDILKILGFDIQEVILNSYTLTIKATKNADNM